MIGSSIIKDFAQLNALIKDDESNDENETIENRKVIFQNSINENQINL